MPNTQSAKKALRSSSRKRQYNLIAKYKIKNSLKEFRKALEIDPSSYQATLSKAFSALDKAVKSNLIHRNKADRKKSRLALKVTKILRGETAVKEPVEVEKIDKIVKK
jgi:small subunit ribosomal protein S20